VAATESTISFGGALMGETAGCIEHYAAEEKMPVKARHAIAARHDTPASRPSARS
jgi:hypothetical protein